MTDGAGDTEVLRATAEEVAAELAATVAAAAGQLVDLVPDDPAGTLGRLGDSRDPLPPVPAWRQRLLSHTQRVTGSASPYTTARDRVGSVSSAVAHRLLGALEAAVRDLDVPVAEVTALRLGAVAAADPDAPGEHFHLTDVESRFDAFAVPTQLVGLRAPATEPLVVALVHALAGTPAVAAVLDVDDGPVPWMAAEHGRRHLAVAVAVSAVVVRAAARVGDPACPDGPEAVVGVAIEAVSRVLHERPMPPAWAAARLREHRAGWVLPRRTAVRLRALGGRFALVEGAEGGDVPEAGPGRVTVVPGGVVVRTRAPDAAVELEVDVDAGPPGEPTFEDWDEIVEVSFVAATGGATAVGEPGSVWPEWEFGLAFPWPGPVRVRVHARDRDGGPERYLLQIWEEAEPSPDAVLRADDPARLVLPRVREDHPVIIRTAFGDDAAWQALCGALVTLDPDDPRRLPVVDDERFADLTPDELVALAGPGWSERHGVLYVVDRRTLSAPDRPVLVVGLLDDDRGRSFRTTAATVCGIDANLQIGNLSFVEFADAADGEVLDPG